MFGDAAQMDKLNSIVWPVIKARIEGELRQQRAAGVQYVVLEAAVLLEAGWADLVQRVWVICVEPATAVRRIMQRNGLSEEEARQRVNYQASNAERIALAGPKAVVVHNDSTLEAFTAAIGAPRPVSMALRHAAHCPWTSMGAL